MAVIAIAGRRSRPKPSATGTAVAGWAALGGLVLVLPLASPNPWDARIALIAVYALIGLSVRLLLGHAGLASLGQHAFVGVGAFVSAWAVTRIGGIGFVLAVPMAGLAGAALAGVVAAAAARVGSAFIAVALATFAIGRVAEATIFGWRALSGGRAGVAAPRPAAFHSDQAYAYLCLAILVGALLFDWRLGKTKGGRALAAIRRDPRVASTLGIDAWAYRMLALTMSGFLAGVAGSLLAHLNGVARPSDFTLLMGLTWLAMVVVGGVGSRAGVIVASGAVALLSVAVPGGTVDLPLLGPRSLVVLPAIVGAALLVGTLLAFPAGLGGLLTWAGRRLGVLAEPAGAIAFPDRAASDGVTRQDDPDTSKGQETPNDTDTPKGDQTQDEADTSKGDETADYEAAVGERPQSPSAGSGA